MVEERNKIMRIREINEHIAQIAAENLELQKLRPEKILVGYKKLLPLIHDKLKKELESLHIKDISLLHHTIRLVIESNYGFDNLRKIAYGVLYDIHPDLKTEKISHVVISHGKYKNEVFYHMFAIIKDGTHTKSIKIDEDITDRLKNSYPDIMNLFNEGMTIHDDFTSQLIDINVNKKEVVFHDFQTLPTILKIYS